MPIAFSCPNCGKFTTVADQYAGQSGPCASCGATITIPAASPLGSYAAQPKASGPSGVLVGVIVALSALALCVVLCAGGAWFALSASMAKAREAARRMESTNNMRQILLAMHNYHDMYQELPPAVVKDANGKPLYSGMVLLLPFLEQNHVYQQFDKSKAWDAPENRVLALTDIRTLKNPNSQNFGQGITDYRFVGGPQSLLDAGGKRTLTDCTDGTSNTMVLVEVKGSGNSWAEPVVWTPDQPFDSHTPNVVIVGMADGSVHSVNKNIPQQQLRLLADPKDGIPVSVP